MLTKNINVHVSDGLVNGVFGIVSGIEMLSDQSGHKHISM